MRKYNRNLITNILLWLELEWNNSSPDFGEGGSYFDEFAQPDTRTAEELFPWDFEWWESAWAWNNCDIESEFNEIRKANNQDEIHDPECNSDNADSILNDLNS